jgi:hypothetical protein
MSAPDANDCESAFADKREFSLTYGWPVTGDVFQLRNGNLIFVGFYGSIIIDLVGVPSDPVSFGNSLFFLPEARLKKALEAAGANVLARYKIFLEGIRECKAAELYQAAR